MSEATKNLLSPKERIVSNRRIMLVGLLVAALIFVCVQDVLAASTWKGQQVDAQGSGGSIAFDSEGNPHIAYSYRYMTNDSLVSWYAYGLKYAVWNGNNWNIQTIDSTGSGGILALDSQDRPHILYAAGYDLKYAISDGNNWNIQTIDSTDPEIGTIKYSMALDSNGNPHAVYSTFNYAKNYNNGSYTEDIKYAVFNGVKWDIQIVDVVNVTIGNLSPSLVLDSNNNPHMIYLETVQYFYKDNSTNVLGRWETYNVKYASLNGLSWQIQTVLSNCSGIGNLVVDSKLQPNFCYTHQSFSFVPKDFGNVNVDESMNYAYWNGNVWLFREIDSLEGRPYLSLDSSGNPQIYCYVVNDQNHDESSLMYANWTGLNWDVQNLGTIPKNAQNNNEYIGDIAFGINGSLSLTYYEQTGTFRTAPFYGNLTFASLQTNGISPNSSFSPTLSIVTAFTIIIIVIALLLFHRIHRKSKLTVLSITQRILIV